MTINQARANYKRYFKVEVCPEELTVEQIQTAITDAKAKAAFEGASSEYEKVFGSKPADGLTTDQIVELIKAEKEKQKLAAKTPKFKVNFGVDIPKMGKFTKEELEANLGACEYLHDIGSPAVTKL